jgi:hypothetical protein
MLTESEQDIIRRWNDFYLRPRQGSVHEQRTRLAEYFEEFNANPPAIGAYHEAVALKSGLTADIAVPRGEGPHPVVIYIHGGAWTLGSPATHRKLVKQFAEGGYLTIAPDYRLARSRPSGRLKMQSATAATGLGSRWVEIPRVEISPRRRFHRWRPRHAVRKSKRQS